MNDDGDEGWMMLIMMNDEWWVINGELWMNDDNDGGWRMMNDEWGNMVKDIWCMTNYDGYDGW